MRFVVPNITVICQAALFYFFSAIRLRAEARAVIHFLYQKLGEEKREGTDEAAIAKHAELLTVLTNYVAKDRVAKAVADLESIIKEMPESDQAIKAALALEALKSESGHEARIRSRDRKDRGLKVRPLTNPEETTPEGQ